MHGYLFSKLVCLLVSCLCLYMHRSVVHQSAYQLLQDGKHAKLWMGIKVATAMQLSTDWGVIQKQPDLKQVQTPL